MQISRRRGAAVALCALLAGGIGACDERGREVAEEAEDEPPAVAAAVARTAPVDERRIAGLPPGVTVEMAEQGRELYAVCVPCHGFEASGTQLGPSLRDDDWIHGSGFDDVVRVIRDGVADPEEYELPMPVLGGGDFTPEQVRAVAAYVLTLGPDAEAS